MSTALSALASARSTLERLTPTAGRPLLLYALYTVVLFAIFLLATFPYELAIRQGLQQALGRAMTAEVTGARLGWTLATSIDELQILPRGAAGRPVLRAQALRVRPSLLGLLGGNPFPIAATARLYSGTIEGTLDPRPESFTVDASVAAVDLGRYTGLGHFSGGTMRGRLNLTVALAGDRTAPTTLNGHIALSALDLSLEGIDIRGITIPDLHFGQLQIGGTVIDGRVDITQLSGNGTEIDLAGSGHLLLRNPLQASLLNMEVMLTPTAQAPQGLRLAVQLIPGTAGPDDTRIVQISGTLGAPKVR